MQQDRFYPQAQTAPELSSSPAWSASGQRALSALLALVFAATAYAGLRRGDFVDPGDIDEALLEAPVQEATDVEPFALTFAGTTYEVRPQFSYELTGLVVTHNDPAGFGDVYHDERSVDTRDLCVIWGTNLETKDFQRVSYSSGSFVCNFRWPAGVDFNPKELSNNHLITDDASVRRTINGVRVGDQVRLTGLLVDYKDPRTDFVRRSSTTRDDAGMGACEVMYVDEIEVLARGTPTLYALYDLGRVALLLLLLAKLALFVFAETRGRGAPR